MARGRRRETAERGLEIERPEPQEITVKATAPQVNRMIKVKFIKNWVYEGGCFHVGDRTELDIALVMNLERSGSVIRNL